MMQLDKAVEEVRS